MRKLYQITFVNGVSGTNEDALIVLIKKMFKEDIYFKRINLRDIKKLFSNHDYDLPIQKNKKYKPRKKKVTKPQKK